MDSSDSARLERWARRFFFIWSGQAVSLLGSSLVQFALVWWLTSKTGSATVLASATLVALLPQIILGPFVGPLVDRHNRKTIMILADGAIALATAGLMVLFWLGLAQTWHVFGIILIRSLGGSFHQPAMSSSTSLMVPEKHLARIGGLNQTLSGVMTLAAPPLGALMIMALPMQAVLAVDVLTACMAIVPLLFVRIPSPHGTNPVSEKSSYWKDMKAGLSYTLTWPGLRTLLLLAMFLNFLLIPSSSLQPLVVKNIFGKGAMELAWVEAAFGLGMIAGGLLLSAWGGFKRRMTTSVSGILGIGLGVAMIGLIPPGAFPLMLVAGFFTAFAQVFANGPLNAIFQSVIQPDMQGRVFSLIGAACTAMMPLSLMIAGPFSDRFGLRAWYLIGGGLCVAVAIWAFFMPSLHDMEKRGKEAALAPSGAQASEAAVAAVAEAPSGPSA